MFLWLGMKQTTAFLFSPQIICPNKRQLSWGEMYNFSSVAPFRAPSPSTHFHSPVSDFQPAERQSLLLLSVRASFRLSQAC